VITIIADRQRFSNAPVAALLATGPADYVPVRRRIRQALDQGESLVVYATDPVILGWLADLQRYPETRVTWREIDPGETFMRLFGAAPAAPFTPRLIAALQLDRLPRPPAGVIVHPLTWVLGHRLDPLWQHDEPSFGHAALLAAWALCQTTALDTELVPLAQSQLERWAVQRPLYKALRATTLSDDGAQLLVRWALQRYDANWRKLQPWGNLPLLEGEPDSRALITALHRQHQAIQAYWNRQMSAAPLEAASIAAALAQMSGLSEAELAALTTMVQRCPDALDRRFLQAVTVRFARLTTADAAASLRSLAEEVAPPEPPMPDPTWPVERWLSWATQAYLPYFAWVIRTGRGRDRQQLCALQYSDWLYSQYPSWLNDSSSPLLLSQYQDMATLVDGDARAVVIWLIIDGMTWWQGELMREACVGNGLHSQAQRPGVAVLPSITSISKRALVTGQAMSDLGQATIAETARAKLMRSNIRASVGDNLPDAIKALRERNDLQVCVVLFNMIDMLAHQTSTFTDDQGIRGYLEALAHDLGSAQRLCAEQGRRLHVLIGSDHGSTRLPDTASAAPLPTMVREIDEIWEAELPEQEARKVGTRAAVTDREQLPSIDPQVWYTLDRDRFQLDQHYLVPRGYRYIKRRPSGWTHGGLSPEETIVPLLHLTSEQPHVLPIEIEFRGTLRAGQAGEVMVVLRNVNPFPVHDLHLMFADGPDEVLLMQLGALAQHEVALQFPTVMVQTAELLISYELHYHVYGTPYHDVGHARIALRRLQTEDSSFDDMFN